MKIAAVTMVRNERLLLPFWTRHYAGQVGAEACYVIDQGSDDGGTDALGAVNRVRIPRSELDETVRAGFVSEFCASLLRWYDWVIYADVDEMLVADPRRYRGLAEYCEERHADVVTAFGVNVLHRLGVEREIDPGRAVLGQRRWAFPSASMCKPMLARAPVRRSPGFHCSDAPIVFDGLVNFHLAYCDLDVALARQIKRRATLADNPAPPAHHMLPNDTIKEMMQGWSGMPLCGDVMLTEGCRHMTEFADRVLASRAGRAGDVYKIDLGLWGDRLWNVPERFYGSV